jgi:hypothetical protein
MRSLIVVTILCLTSTPAFACVFDTDCKPGSTCRDSMCSGDLPSDNDHDDVPVKRSTGKTCVYDDDCQPGSRCIKGSGIEGVCIGH